MVSPRLGFPEAACGAGGADDPPGSQAAVEFRGVHLDLVLVPERRLQGRRHVRHDHRLLVIPGGPLQEVQLQVQDVLRLDAGRRRRRGRCMRNI